MGILIKVLAIICALTIIIVITVTWKIRSSVNERMAEADKEYATVETADWYGQTVLDNETERELPRYLRREFGESLFEEGALITNNLIYLGVFKSLKVLFITGASQAKIPIVSLILPKLKIPQQVRWAGEI